MADDETGVFKDDEGNIYVDTDPDDDWSGSDAADRGDAIDDNDSSSSSSSSSSGGGGGSSSSSGGGSDPDDPSDAKNVIVSGGGSSGEPQTVVGTGDTKEEAQVDAATSGDFSADEGTEIDQIQDRLNSDPNRVGRNVQVTGGGSSGEPQTVVGTGTSIFQSQAAAASNRDFDASQGTRIDAIETASGSNQGDGTKIQQAYSNEARQRREENNTENIQASTEIPDFQDRALGLQRRSNRNENTERFENPEKYTDIFTFLNPWGDNPNANFFEEATTAGVDLMQGSQEFGDFVSEQTTGRFNDAFTDLTTPEVTDSQGNAADLTEEEEEFFQGRASTGIQRTDDFIDLGETFTGGIAQGPGVLTGLGISSVGAIPMAAQETGRNLNPNEESEGPGLVEGAFTGFEITGEAFADNPGEFIAEEAGEEVGEAIVGGLIAGPAGFVAGAAPTFTPEVTPDVPSSTTRNIATNTDSPFSSNQNSESTQALQEESGQINPGDLPDLGTQRDPGRTGLPEQSGESQFIPQEERATGEELTVEDGFTQNELEVLADEPVGPGDVNPETQTETGGFSQTEANRQRQRIVPEEERTTFDNIREFIGDLPQDRKGQANLIQEQSPRDIDTGVETEITEPSLSRPENDVEQSFDIDTFSERSTGNTFSSETETIPELESNIESSLEVNPFVDQGLEINQAQEPASNETQDTGFEIGPEEENQFEIDFDIENTQEPSTDPTDDPFFTPETGPEIDPRTELISEPELENRPTSETDGNREREEDEDELFGGFFGDSQDFQFQRSVAADLLNLEEDEGARDEFSAGNPFNLRQ